MGYWVYELLDLWDHELMGSLIWFVGFMNFVGYKFLMDFGSMGYRFTDLGNIGFLGVCVFILLVLQYLHSCPSIILYPCV